MNHTFPNGVEITISPIGRYQVALFRAGLDTKYPKPEPPINKTDLGDLSNPDDPAYLSEVEQWEMRQQSRLNLVVLRQCVDFVHDFADDLARYEEEIERSRSVMRELGLPTDVETAFERDVFSFDGSSKMRYLYLVAAGGDVDELAPVLSLIVDNLGSREVAIKAAEAAF